MERDRRNGIIVLALLSPFIGEVVSGSSPPLELLNPLSFPLLVGLYGAGALLVRELSVIWKKGWLGIVILGLAYGIIEEGLGVKSFFDPGWMDLGAMASYGRWLGVNWAWAYWLTLYHSLVSITIPILLFETIYPRWRGKRLLDGKKLWYVFGILTIVVILCYLALTPYRPPVGLYLGALVSVVVIGYIAWKIPAGTIKTRSILPVYKTTVFYILGTVFMTTTFILVFVIPNTTIPPWMMICLQALLSAVTLYFLRNCIGRHESELHRLAFVAGVMTPFIFFDFILELAGIRGMAVIGIFFSYLLYRIANRVIKRTI